jgi:hypothetical protein
MDTGYRITINPGGIQVGGRVGTHGPTGTPPSDLATFTYDYGFQYGIAGPPMTFVLEESLTGGGGTDLNPGTGTSSSNSTLSVGNFIVLDAQNNPVSFTAESRTGSARSSNIVSGAPFSGFTLTNSAPDRLGTTMSLRDGTASAATNVTAAFVAPPPTGVIQLASDAVDLSGTGSDLVVIQINYDPATAKTLFGARLVCASAVNSKAGSTRSPATRAARPNFFLALIMQRRIFISVTLDSIRPTTSSGQWSTITASMALLSSLTRLGR